MARRSIIAFVAQFLFRGILVIQDDVVIPFAMQSRFGSCTSQRTQKESNGTHAVRSKPLVDTMAFHLPLPTSSGLSINTYPRRS